MSKLVLIVLFSLGFSSPFAFAKARLPVSTQGFKIVYYDYLEDEPFNFSKLSKTALEEIQDYLLLAIDEINASLSDPQSQLRRAMAAEKADTFIIKILPEVSTEPATGLCPPYMDDGDFDVCATTTVLHIYGNQLCISKRAEYSTMAIKELTEPSCDVAKKKSGKKKNRQLFSIPGRTHFKQLDVNT